MKTRSVHVAALLAALGTAPALAQPAHIERRPCVAPDSPTGCDGSISEGPPLSPGAAPPPATWRPQILDVPLKKTPEAEAVPPPPAQGTVTVAPANQIPATTPTPPGTSGPPALR
jgi:hypothetical protein